MWPFSRKKPQQPIPLMTTAEKPSAATQSTAVAKQQATVVQAPSHSVDLRAEGVKSVISSGEYIEGTLRFQNGVKVDGRVKGCIEFGLLDGLLVLNNEGVVEGNIQGPRAIIVGEVFGNVVIKGKLILLPQSRVHGDIAAGTLQVMEGATIHGRITTFSDYDKHRTLEHDDGADVTTGDHSHSEAAPASERGSVLRFAVSNG